MKLRKGAIVLAMAAAMVGTTPLAANAAEGSNGIIASYNGERIDLSKGWGGAQACVEFAIGDVRCYDSAQEADRALRGDVSTRALTDCPSGWVCLWQHPNYKGRRLQWSASGTKKLADWGFRDKASSAAVSRVQGGVECRDYRTGLPDPRMFLAAGGAYKNFANVGYPTGGSWDNKIDEIRI